MMVGITRKKKIKLYCGPSTFVSCASLLATTPKTNSAPRSENDNIFFTPVAKKPKTSLPIVVFKIKSANKSCIPRPDSITL